MKIRMNLVTIPIDKIVANPWNPNEQSDYMFEKERESIRRHGFIDPILVRELGTAAMRGAKAKYEIVDGEQRWKAAQAEGATEIPANNLGPINDVIARQLTVVMNETRGHARHDKMSALLRGLIKDGVTVEELQAALPYKPDEIGLFVNEATVDWSKVKNPEPVTVPNVNQPAAKASDHSAVVHVCPKCGHKFGRGANA